jgi:uncharacterized protein with FMN-binding domain
MPKRGAIALSLTALALVLLLNFQVPAGMDVARGASGTGGGGTGAIGTTGTTGGTASGTGSGGSPAQVTGTRTITGPTVNTRWGPVQVSVTVEGSQLTDVTALQLPDGDRRSSSISSRVEPILRSQALQVQGAAIDGVSGATYTSQAYAQSLQAALDGAGS